MNTNRLKKFAQETRKKLLEQVSAKVDYVLTTETPELREKAALVATIKDVIAVQGKRQLVDRVAYTWFNRFVALRYMDVNDYQPLTIRIVSALRGQVSPQILQEAIAGHIPEDLNINEQKVFDLLDGRIESRNAENEAYRYLLIGACNYLNRIFPFLFERINDYTELLLPDDLTSQFSVLHDLVMGMTEEDCSQVECIGWLYQFYISEKKDEVFAAKSKVKKEDIPAATQLFTPRWIVEYMVQNTVGKIWMQNRPNSGLKQHMPYYIESEASKGEDYLKISSPEELTLLDQACGSGHILVYGFELLYKIYEEQGYNPSEIPALIIKNNLFGFEIDSRAAQLAGMAVLLKAREYSKRLFKKAEIPEPQILCFSDHSLSSAQIKEVFSKLGIKLSDELHHDLNLMSQASNFGSLVAPKSTLQELTHITKQLSLAGSNDDLFLQNKLNQIHSAVDQLIVLAGKYCCIVDNPPYMGDSKLNKPLSDFVNANYSKSRLDLMTCFMEAGIKALRKNGFLGMINQHSWMFISSYKELRKHLVESISFQNMLHLGPRTFPEIGGEVVQSTAFTLLNKQSKTGSGKYFRLVDYNSAEKKRLATINAINQNHSDIVFLFEQDDLKLIPNYNLCYWFSKKVIENFRHINIDKISTTKAGIVSGNDNDFLRLWYEVRANGLSLKSVSFSIHDKLIWVPINKGGSKRKYFGNEEYVINLYNLWLDGRTNKSVRRGDSSFYFKQGITWTYVCGTSFSFRLSVNCTFATAAPAIFLISEKDTLYCLGLLNSKVVSYLLPGINPTMNLGSGDISRLPFIKDNHFPQIDELVSKNIEINREEWFSSETSWGFQRNELLKHQGQDLEEAYDLYRQYWRNKFFQLHNNEEELNRQFIEIYGLQEEQSPDVSLEDITILKEETSIENGQLAFHAEEVMAQFISYAVGCMLGRYSLDKDGLILATQGETVQDYYQKIGKTEAEVSFAPDKDNIIPILEDEWFEDDVVTRFFQFLKTTYGEKGFQKNLGFLEEQLGCTVRKYFTREFYAHHIQRYKKRPIYWMFSSPKGHFNVLIYMHRYTPDTLNVVLNNYLRAFIEKLKVRIETLKHIEVTGSPAEKTRALKEMDKNNAMLLDCHDYQRNILYPLATERIAIDLDNGVLVNYNCFGKAVKEVVGLNDAKTKKKVKEFDWIDPRIVR